MSPSEPELLVSIIIPLHNRLDLTSACLESIERHTPVAHEIIVVDDASGQETRDYLRSKEPGIRILRNEQRQSFSRNNNQAAAVAQGKYLCLLNNDTVVLAGWLDSMVKVMQENPGIGVLGNKHLFPSTNLLHHCGMAYDRDGHPQHLHPHTDPALPSVNYQRDLQCMTFACVMIPRTIYKELGGLDEAYRNGYEDCDFCARAITAGYRVTYTPASTIYHYGQATPGRKTHDDSNFALFDEKWAGKVIHDFDRLSAGDIAYNNSIQSRPRLRPKPDTGIHFAFNFSEGDAMGWAAAELALALADSGQRVSIPLSGAVTPTLGLEKSQKLSKLMRERPFKSVHIKNCHYWEKYLHQDLSGDVNAELFVTNYRFRGDAAWRDHWSEHMRLNEHKKLPLSGFCTDSLVDVGVDRSQSAVVPPGYASEIDLLFREGVQGKNATDGDLKLFVITNSHDLYRYGSDLLVQALGAAFGPNDPVVVHIKDYGAHSGNRQLKQWIASEPRFPRVVWHEQFVAKEDLLKLTASMDVMLAPFRGEGYSMKILDTMALGVPVLMPAFGGPLEYAANGTFIPLAFDETPVGECYDTAHFHVGPGAYWCGVQVTAMVQELRSLVDRRKELAAVGARARAAVIGKFTWANAAEKMLKALELWQPEHVRVVSARRRPSIFRMSVVIPTKDRPDTLQKTLDGYCTQSVSKSDFEIVIVNDHGSRAEVSELVRAYSSRLQLRLLDNAYPPGPGNARNFAMEQASGDILFITGDDIIPAPDLVERHLTAHKECPEVERAFVGLNLWHPEVQLNWMMLHIVGDGGHQFNYTNMLDGQVVPFDRFYTSNVSLKRDFAIELNPLFSSHFPCAAFEDIEFAYRLHLHGMELRYLERAVGYHLHQMSLPSFLERQRRVGRMLTVIAAMRPRYVPQNHTRFLRLLEAEYERRRGAPEEVLPLPSWKPLVDMFSQYYVLADAYISQLKDVSGDSVIARGTRQVAAQHISVRQYSFDLLCEVMLRLGMAEQWASGKPELDWAGDWGTSCALTDLFNLKPDAEALAASAPWLMNGNMPEVHAFGLHAALLQLQTGMRSLQDSNAALSANAERQSAEIEATRAELRGEVSGIQRWIDAFSIQGRAKEKLLGLRERISHTKIERKSSPSDM